LAEDFLRITAALSLVRVVSDRGGKDQSEKDEEKLAC